VLRTLLQPRYAALSALMLVVAAICTTAGVWQVVRLDEKVVSNDDLRRNAHAPAGPVASVLPVVGQAPRPSSDQVKYRTVTAAGVYLSNEQVLVRQRSVNSDTGYLVLTPLRTDAGPTLLVVRGFVSGSGRTTDAPPTASAPPAGPVDITARVEPPETRDDQFGALRNGQVESINAGQQAARDGSAFYNGYANLGGGQPGSAGLVEIPGPDLSNPAGGAIEPQHIAYVIQWFLFAALALAAPFAMARAEARRDSGRPVGRDLSGDDEPDELVEPRPEAPVTAHLADRYGRAGRHLH
jgi:cytochrome oxidase assembly protein ShyY1